MSEAVTLAGERFCECGCGTKLGPERKRWASNACKERARRRRHEDQLERTVLPELEPLCRCGVVGGGHHFLLPGEEWEIVIGPDDREYAFAPHVPDDERLMPAQRKELPPPHERREALLRLEAVNRALGRVEAAERCHRRAAEPPHDEEEVASPEGRARRLMQDKPRRIIADPVEAPA